MVVHRRHGQVPDRRQGVSGTRTATKRPEPDRVVPETAWWSTGATLRSPTPHHGVSGTQTPLKRHEPDRVVPETAWWSTGATARSPTSHHGVSGTQTPLKRHEQTAPCRRRHGGPPAPPPGAQPHTTESPALKRRSRDTSRPRRAGDGMVVHRRHVQEPNPSLTWL